MVVVDVDISKDVLHEDVHHLARLQKIADTLRVNAPDNSSLVTRLPAIDVLRNSFFDGERQYEPVVIRTELHLVDEPLLASERRFFYALWRDVVDGQRQLLVAVVLIEIMAR